VSSRRVTKWLLEYNEMIGPSFRASRVGSPTISPKGGLQFNQGRGTGMMGRAAR